MECSNPPKIMIFLKYRNPKSGKKLRVKHTLRETFLLNEALGDHLCLLGEPLREYFSCSPCSETMWRTSTGLRILGEPQGVTYTSNKNIET